jgi:hypothetical protein
MSVIANGFGKERAEVGFSFIARDEWFLSYIGLQHSSHCGIVVGMWRGRINKQR